MNPSDRPYLASVRVRGALALECEVRREVVPQYAPHTAYRTVTDRAACGGSSFEAVVPRHSPFVSAARRAVEVKRE